MTLAKLPLTVVAGYLGAGKTTLINRLLAEPHGLRLLVMVNDFGAINIDADLLESADEDTLTLTNGCVCCTMGADLFMAMGDALDRRPRPDHLVIEASGIADPIRIANAAVAEPEMLYGGIVTVIDGLNFPTLADDGMIGPQIRAQVAGADLVLVSKCDLIETGLARRLAELTRAPCLSLAKLTELAPLVLGAGLMPRAAAAGAGHPAYVSWSYEGPAAMTQSEIRDCLANRPAGLFRVKGWIRENSRVAWEVQVVADRVSITPAKSPVSSRLIGIGLAARVNQLECDKWWQTACLARKRP
jgi:G3E family GTPase